MNYDPMTRRFFIRGLGGSILMLPILPSLMPKAYANNPEQFLVIVGSQHGATGIDDWFPAPVAHNLTASQLTQHTLHPVGGENGLDHIIRHGNLSSMLTADPGHAGGNVDNGQARLSYILGSHFNPFLNKMILYRGIDGGMFGSGHSWGNCSGNLKAHVNTNTDDVEAWPSMDQFLALQSSFYPDKSKISMDVFGKGMISFLENGDMVRTDSRNTRISQYYNSLFEKYDSNSTPAEIAQRAKKTFLLDRVLGNLNRFLNGAHGPARKISSVDKIRVEEFADKMHTLQQTSQTVVNSCADVTGPISNVNFNRSQIGGLPGLANSYDLLTDLIVAAFQCGSTKLSSLLLGENESDYSGPGGYHNDVAHNLQDPAMRLVHSNNFRWQGQHVITKLAAKMDAVSVDGQNGSLLDNGLIQWSHECGDQGHSFINMGCLSIGSLSGHFNPGKYVDYRNMKNMGLKSFDNSSVNRPGLPIQKLWANIIQGYGVSKSQFERHGRGGYGHTGRNDFPSGQASNHLNHQPYPARITNALSDPMPIVQS